MIQILISVDYITKTGTIRWGDLIVHFGVGQPLKISEVLRQIRNWLILNQNGLWDQLWIALHFPNDQFTFKSFDHIPIFWLDDKINITQMFQKDPFEPFGEQKFNQNDNQSSIQKEQNSSEQEQDSQEIDEQLYILDNVLNKLKEQKQKLIISILNKNNQAGQTSLSDID